MTKEEKVECARISTLLRLEQARNSVKTDADIPRAVDMAAMAVGDFLVALGYEDVRDAMRKVM